MAYGLKVWASDGTPRVYSDSWFMRYHSTHSYNLSANQTKDVSIPGFNPQTWGIIELITWQERPGFGTTTVSLHAGRIRLVNTSSHYGAYVSFKILEG